METTALESLGINPTAAELYVAALSLGPSSVQDLAKKIGIKRPSAYFHVEELLKIGLLEKLPIGKREYYQASHPKIIEQRLHKQLKSVQQAVEDFEAHQAKSPGRPQVKLLTGETGLTEIYDEILTANSIRFWSDLAALEQAFAYVFVQLNTAIMKQQITTREIIHDSPQSRRAAKRARATASQHYQVRVATTGAIHNDSIIYNDVLVFIRLQEYNLYAVRIEEPTIVESMKTLFDMAWKTAKPL